MNKTVKCVLIGTGAAAALLLLTELMRRGAANYMVRVALDRRVPPHPIWAEQRLIAGCANEEMLRQMHNARTRFSSCEHETVCTTSQDGTALIGHWFPVEKPRRIIIAMHGWRSAWDNDFGLVADFFRDNKCSVLYAEQRGQGRSGGQYIGFGLTERYDCLEWIRWANEKAGGKLPIYLCGVSMGASTVLMATGLELPQNVRGIIADCGYTSPVEIWKHVAKQAHFSYYVCSKPVGRLAGKRLCMPVDAVTCPGALAENKVPVLFVHGTDDRFVPIEMTYENYKACAGPKRLFIVPGAQHGMSYLTDPAGYQSAVKAFWSDFDEGSSV